MGTVGSDYEHPSRLAVSFLTYSGLTNARLQLAVHPKIKPELKDPLMKRRGTHIKAAKNYHKETRSIYDQLPKIWESSEIDQIILEIDGLCIKAKQI